MDSPEAARIRILMKNVAYVGALAAFLDIDLDIIRKLIGLLLFGGRLGFFRHALVNHPETLAVQVDA
mgnify:CR=1 FL=1